MRKPFRSLLPFLSLLAAVLLPAVAHAQTESGLTADDLFRDDGVKQIHLFMNSKDWKELQDAYKENTYYPADLHWNGMVVRNVGIRSRGTGSRNPIKPGLRVDFDRYSTSQKFLGLKSFVLDNMVQDLPMMRERLVMNFLTKMGRPAPREVHTGLWVNNQFIGLYTIDESIDKSYLERVFGENDGYLYEYNNVPGWYFTTSGFDASLDNLARIFEPKTRESDPIAAQLGPVQQMLNDANGASDFAGAVGRNVDLEDFVRYLATEQFLSERDGMVGYDGSNNFYLYKSPVTGTIRFLSWDKDNSFYGWDRSIWANVELNPLAARALSDARLRGIYLETLEQAAAAIMAPPDGASVGTSAVRDEPAPVQGWLEREIRRIYAQIHDGALLDYGKLVSNERFEEEVQYPAGVLAEARGVRAGRGAAGEAVGVRLPPAPVSLQATASAKGALGADSR